MIKLHTAVRLPLEIRDLTHADLEACAWSGSRLHLMAVSNALRRAETGEVDYLALCPPSGVPVAIGGVDYTLFDDAGYLWQLGVHPMLQRCGIGTRLVAALEDRVVRRGRHRSELRYESDQAGNRAFYERLGYVAYGTARDCWDRQLPNGEVVRHETTCVKMRRDLRQAIRP